MSSSINTIKCGISDNYITNISYVVDAGFEPCRNDYLYFTNGDNILYYDYTFDESSRLLELSLTTAQPPVNECYGAVLCGANGSSQCFRFCISNISECDFCTDLSINPTADCNDNDPNDDVYKYAGSFNINVPPGAVPCGYASSGGGYSQNPIANGNNSYTINYSINTNNPGLYNQEVTLCFFDGQTHCYNLSISIAGPCNENACLFSEDAFTVRCSQIENDISFYNLGIATVIPNAVQEEYSLCDVDGITTNYGTVHQIEDYSGVNALIAVFDLELECEDMDVNGGRILVTLNYCNEEGDPFCVEYDLGLDCPGCPHTRSRINNNSYDYAHYRIYPNPASERLNIEVDAADGIHRLVLFRSDGRKVLDTEIITGLNSIDVSWLPEGMYLAKLYVGTSEIEKKIILTR